MTTFPTDAPTAPAGMMQYSINNQSTCPNVSVTIQLNEAMGIGLTYKLTVYSPVGCALQECPMVLSPQTKIVNISLLVDVNYTATLMASNDCGSVNTTVVIHPLHSGKVPVEMNEALFPCTLLEQNIHTL